MKEKILQKSFELFLRLGIKSISMDDIARELGTSKKTVYQYFENKDALVESALQEFLKQLDIPEKVEPGTSLMQLQKTVCLINEKSAGLTGTFFYDLRKYHRKAQQHLEHFREATLLPFIVSCIKAGVAEGYFRNDLNPEIASRFWIAQYLLILDGETFPSGQFNLSDVRKEVFTIFLMGLVTEKGKEILNTTCANNTLTID